MDEKEREGGRERGREREMHVACVFGNIGMIF